MEPSQGIFWNIRFEEIFYLPAERLAQQLSWFNSEPYIAKEIGGNHVAR